jgi:hypothetical protein
MNAEERDLDLALADAEAENRKLKARIADLEQVTNSARDMVSALNGLSDYPTWSRLLAKLEKDLSRL